MVGAASEMAAIGRGNLDVRYLAPRKVMTRVRETQINSEMTWGAKCRVVSKIH